MLCRLIIDPPASGAWNMAVDEALLESAATNGELSLRFYQWEEPTLSLGYFQLFEDRQKHTASQNCAVVRRATGGGAILHDREITYSIAVPPGNRLAVKHLALYETIHTVLISLLADYGIKALLCSEKDLKKADELPFLCFQRRSPGDVLLSNEKIAGSAQRRYQGAVLQHGSVLLAGSIAAPELPGIADITTTFIDFDRLLNQWISKLAETYSLKFKSADITYGERHRAEELMQKKYYSLIWTQHRGRGR